MISYKEKVAHRRSPLIFLFATLLFAVGEIMYYTDFPGGSVLQILGSVLGFWSVYHFYLYLGNTRYETIRLQEIVLVILVGLVSGMLAMGIANTNIPFAFLICEVFAFWSLTHIGISLVYIYHFGVSERWWVDWHAVTWTTPLTMLVVWAVVAALGLLLAGSPVPLFDGVGQVSYTLRWWAGILFPISLAFRWVFNSIQSNKYLRKK